jgi:cytochrome c-type biogenesis protein CcmF
VFIAALLVGSFALFAARAQSILPPDAGKVWGISKESALVVTQFLLLTLAAIVFIGTVFPIVTEAVSSQRISIQAPYFNAFAPWIGLAMIVAIAMGNLLRYHSGKIPGGRALLVRAGLAAILPAAAFCWAGDVFKTTRPWSLGAQIVGVYLVMWSLLCLGADFAGRLKPFAKASGNPAGRLMAFVRRNTAYTGAFIAHVGVLLAILGFLGNYRGVDREVTLRAGETASLFGYDFTLGTFRQREVENAILFEAPLAVSRNGQEVGTVYPAKSKYPTKPELMNEVGVLGGFWHDVYAVMVDFEKTRGETVTLQLHINPTVRLVFLSVLIMVLGGVVAAFDRVRGDRSRDVAGGAWEQEA